MSRESQGAAAAPGWPLLAAWGLVAVLGIWLYSPHVYSMARNWWYDANYSHGFLVPAVSAWLVWRQRQSLKALPARPNALGLVVVALGLGLLVLGSLAQEFFLRRFSLPWVAWGLVLAYWGWPVARRVAFAAAYLVLMVPLPYVLYDSVAFPLRLLAAHLAGWGIRLTGLPVLVEGNAIYLPSVSLDVVDACSGIRSLISLLAVGTVLAYIMLPRRWLKVLVALLVPLVAVASNSLRVMITGLLAERWGSVVLEGATHDLVGWLVFMAGFMMLWGLVALLRRLATPTPGRDGHAQ